MRPAKDGESKGPPPPEPEQTPFERFADFARRILAVPKAEMQAQELTFQRAKKKRKRTRAP